MTPWVEVVEVLLEEEPGRRRSSGRSWSSPERGAAPSGRGPSRGRGRARRATSCGEAAGAAARRRSDVGPRAPPRGCSSSSSRSTTSCSGAREQPQRPGVQVGRRVAPDQAVGEGVEGRAHRRPRGAAQPRRDPVAQLLGRLAAEGQGQHRVRASAAASMRSTTASTRVVVLPVPGPASTSSGPPGWSTTARWAASSAGGSTTRRSAHQLVAWLVVRGRRCCHRASQTPPADKRHGRECGVSAPPVRRIRQGCQ